MDMWGFKNMEGRINKNGESLGAAKRGSIEHAILYTASESEYLYTLLRGKLLSRYQTPRLLSKLYFV